MAYKIEIKINNSTVKLFEKDIVDFHFKYKVNQIPELNLSIFDKWENENFEIYSKIKHGADITVGIGIESTSVQVFKGIITQFSLSTKDHALQLVAKGESVKLLENKVSFAIKKIKEQALIKKIAEASGSYRFSDVSAMKTNREILHNQFSVYQHTPWRIIFARMIENGTVFLPSIEGDKIISADSTGDTISLKEADITHSSFDYDCESLFSSFTLSSWDIKKNKKESITIKNNEFDATNAIGRTNLNLYVDTPLTITQRKKRALAEKSFRNLDYLKGKVKIHVKEDNFALLLKSLKLFDKVKFDGKAKSMNIENAVVTGISHTISTRDGWIMVLDIGLPLAYSLDNEAAKLKPMQKVSGIIKGIKKDKDHYDSLLVTIPAIDEKNPLYARVNRPSASKEEGLYLRHKIGDEVLVDFVGGDASYPIILGAMHNPINTLPFTDENTSGWVVITEQGNFSDQVDIKNGTYKKTFPTAGEISTEGDNLSMIMNGEYALNAKKIIKSASDFLVDADSAAFKVNKMEVKQ